MYSFFIGFPPNIITMSMTSSTYKIDELDFSHHTQNKKTRLSNSDG